MTVKDLSSSRKTYFRQPYMPLSHSSSYQSHPPVIYQKYAYTDNAPRDELCENEYSKRCQQNRIFHIEIMYEEKTA